MGMDKEQEQGNFEMIHNEKDTCNATTNNSWRVFLNLVTSIDES